MEFFNDVLQYVYRLIISWCFIMCAITCAIDSSDVNDDVNDQDDDLIIFSSFSLLPNDHSMHVWLLP